MIRAAVNLDSLLEFLRDYEDVPITDGHQHMTVCHGCGEVDYPTAPCAKSDSKCDRVRQPMSFAHIADVLTAAEQRVKELETENDRLTGIKDLVHATLYELGIDKCEGLECRIKPRLNQLKEWVLLNGLLYNPSTPLTIGENDAKSK